jgi:hypothetical protein
MNERCVNCQYFFAVGKFPFYPMAEFNGDLSEKSKLFVCSVFADDEQIMVPTTPDDMCELFSLRQVSESKG